MKRDGWHGQKWAALLEVEKQKEKCWSMERNVGEARESAERSQSKCFLLGIPNFNELVDIHVNHPLLRTLGTNGNPTLALTSTVSTGCAPTQLRSRQVPHSARPTLSTAFGTSILPRQKRERKTEGIGLGL